MLTPPVRALGLAPCDRLDAVLAIYRSRWSAHTIVAARELLATGSAGDLTTRQWFDQLDELETLLAPVAAIVDPQSMSRLRCRN